jgi:hypothetical protein
VAMIRAPRGSSRTHSGMAVPGRSSPILGTCAAMIRV